MTANVADYDNAQVTGATNPSRYGHHHGPIVNANVDWVPPSRAAAVAAGGRGNGPVTAADNAAAPNAAAILSIVNPGVCDIVVNGNQLCGVVFQARGQQPSLRRHIRNEHPGALTNPTRQNVSIAETIAGQNALKLYVRSGGWRRQVYLHEPGTGPVKGYLDLYATQMETIARSDANFAATYGMRFHRPRHEVATPESSRKRKRGPTPPSP